MKKELRENLPTFYTDKGSFSTILTNDMDSLLSASACKHINNWDINYFYDFEGLYVLNPDNSKEYVGLDLALTKGKTIDNHLMTYDYATIHNPQAINLNYTKGITNYSYYKKFPLSTFLLLVSLHDIPLNYQDESFMKFILSIDSAHGGYYSDIPHFKKVFIEWMEDLNLTKMLDILARTPIEEFEAIQAKSARIGKHIKLNDKRELQFGHWEGRALDLLSKKIGFEVALPTGQFTLQQQFNNERFDSSPDVNSFMTDKRVFSYNFTYKRFGKVSVLK